MKDKMIISDRRSCNVCEHSNHDVSRPHRREFAVCDRCNRTLCDACLRAMTVEQGLLEEENAESLSGVGLLFYCDATQENMCADCFEAEEIDDEQEDT